MIIWHPFNTVNPEHIPSAFAKAFFDSGSLTRYFETTLEGNYTLTVLKAALSPLLADEKALLNVNEGYLRESFMGNQTENWLYARCIFPDTLIKSPDFFPFLSNQQQAIGKILFAEASTQRKLIEWTKITQKNTSLSILLPYLKPQNAIWARRSCFNYRGHFLFLSEFFLPNCHFVSK